MNPWNTIGIGLKEIWANKFRSLLTMLGIILGVSSLVAMSALVKGMENGLREAMIAMGGLEKVRIDAEDTLPIHQRHLADQAAGVTLRDVYMLRQGAPLVHNVVPSKEMYGYRDSMGVTRAGKKSRPYIFAGTWPGALELNQHVIEHGRMFNEIDDEEVRSVCVIGTGIRDELFGDPEEVGREINPVGETILINEQPFIVIGMFQHYESQEARKTRQLGRPAPKTEPQSTAQGAAARKSRGFGAKGGHFVYRLKNKTIYIPLRTMLVKFRTPTSSDGLMDARLTSLHMRIPDVSKIEQALQQVRNVMMLSHKGIEDFTFRTQEEWAQEITVVIRNARVSGGIIAAISLIVGGIGIMNIMLASISERVREIGIRKAVGACTSDVFIQILIESLVLALLGGLAGLATSFLLVVSLETFAPDGNAPLITAGSMLLAFAFSAGVGVAAGLFPAIKASRLHPIQALRYD